MSSAVVGSKIGSMLLMVVAGLVGAFIPLFLRKFKMHTAMNLSNAFAGGAFLALGVFHILPDAIKELDEAKVYIYIGNISYNLAYILVFIGYIVILFCESVLFDPSLNEAMSHRDSDSQETSLSGAVISHKCNNLNAERKKEEMYYNKDVEKNDCALVRDSNSSNFENSCIRPVEEKKGDIYVDNNKNDISINVLNDNKYNRSDNWNKDCKNVEQKLKEENIIIEKEISNRNGFNQADFIKVEMDNTTIRTASSSSSNNLILKMEENRTNQVNRKKKKKINKILSVFSSASFFLMIALAIHGFFEGVIVGTSSSPTQVWMTSLVILGHKWAESFALMSQFIAQKLSKKMKVALMSVFVISTPVGIGSGMGLSNADVSSGVCNALGAGTVLFVANEITSHVFADGGRIRFIKFIFYILGSALVLGLTMFELYVESP